MGTYPLLSPPAVQQGGKTRGRGIWARGKSVLLLGRASCPFLMYKEASPVTEQEQFGKQLVTYRLPLVVLLEPR